MTRSTPKSGAAFERARKVLVGGVNSPVRSFRGVGGEPLFIAEARGAWLTDVDGRRYVDYIGGYGPAILGHADERVVEAVARAAGRGLCVGAPTEAEVLLGERLAAAMPSIERIRFVNSGTEAVMTALRLARAATGRPGIVKCVGCYHGHSDAMLVSAGSGAATLGVPSSPGVPEGSTAHTILVPYNNLDAMEGALEDAAGEVAAAIVEPVAGNMGLVVPTSEYLAGLRELCDRHGVLLIFDEVITGFRLGLGGAQGLSNVWPDLTTLGKIIGGGLPVGAVGGREEIMTRLAPEGPVYQAGTLAGNPLAMAAGLATLEAVRQEGFYDRLEEQAGLLEARLREEIASAGLSESLTLHRLGSMLCLFFTPGPVIDFDTADASDTKAHARFFHAMLEKGVHLPPSQFETWFLSAAHGAEELDATVAAFQAGLRAAAER
jgi:glutamate-1-semialdehyde 2,1-aminomutase